jgi:hypothetical protein
VIPPADWSLRAETRVRAFRSRSAADFTVIANGIDVASYTLRDRKDDFIPAAGRICPEKGFHIASSHVPSRKHFFSRAETGA